jgi:hypothetical protein
LKYKTIHIEPTSGRKKWYYRIQLDDTDRVSKKTEPSGLGYYTYPYQISDYIAFVTLKERMIQIHENEISNLQKSLDELKKLEFIKE